MIDRQHNRIVIVCDECQYAAESDKAESYRPFWANLKTEGWTVKELPVSSAQSGWVHTCPDCNS